MRQLTQQEIAQLESQNCSAHNWSDVEVADTFCADYVRDTRFSGHCTLGAFDHDFELPGGLQVHSGIYHATLHNVEVGDNCHLYNIHNYILQFLEDSHEPSPLLTKMREEGKMGFKSGEGFMTWTPEEVEKQNADLNEYLIRMLYGK